MNLLLTAGRRLAKSISQPLWQKAKFWVEPSIELAYNNGFNGIHTSKAKVTMITSRGISLYVNGDKYDLPYDNYPWFREAKVIDILNVEMPNEESLRGEAVIN